MPAFLMSSYAPARYAFFLSTFSFVMVCTGEFVITVGLALATSLSRPRLRALRRNALCLGSAYETDGATMETCHVSY